MNQRKKIDVDAGNYTRLHNQVIEDIAGHAFTARQMRVILAVLRLTYGFNRTHAPLKVREIAAISNLPDNHVRVEIKALVNQNVLQVTGKEIAYNKYSETWNDPKSGSQIGIPNQSPKTVSQIDDERSQVGILSWDPKLGCSDAVQSSDDAGFGDPKDMKDMKRHDHVVIKHSNNSNHAGAGEGQNDTVVLLGFDKLVAAFARLGGKGGILVNDFKRREIRQVVEESGMSCADILAVIDEWEKSRRQANQVVPVIHSANYFIPLLKASKDAAAQASAQRPDVSALEAYFLS